MALRSSLSAYRRVGKVVVPGEVGERLSGPVRGRSLLGSDTARCRDVGSPIGEPSGPSQPVPFTGAD